MIHKTLTGLSKMISTQNDISQWGDTRISGVSINTKTLENGNLFVPLKGENRDGHEFVEMAFEKGASATLWQADVPNPPKNVPVLIVKDTLEALQELARVYRHELNLKIAAVTGSNGKTTTKDILAELLSIKFKVQKTMGNFNNHIGLPLTILSLNEDTEVAVLEMGMSEFGEIDFLTRLAEPDAAIITNIGEAHLQELGSRAGIAKAKLEILNGLKKGGLFVYPGEEPLIKEKIEGISNNWNVKTFGKNNDNDIFPVHLKMETTHSVFQVNQSEEIFRMPVLGEYNVLNAMAAMMVATNWGVPFEKMNEAFSNLKLTQMRMEMTEGINGSRIINDAYNASPTSTKAVIDLVENLEGYQKKIVVLGDMLELGPKEKEFHHEVGEYINPNQIDFIYTFGSLSTHIVEGAKNRFEPNRLLAFQDKGLLIQHLKQNIEKDTLVLIKASRGMKMEEIVEAIKA